MRSITGYRFDRSKGHGGHVRANPRKILQCIERFGNIAPISVIRSSVPKRLCTDPPTLHPERHHDPESSSDQQVGIDNGTDLLVNDIDRPPDLAPCNPANNARYCKERDQIDLAGYWSSIFRS